MPDYPHAKPGQEVVICEDGCGTYYVTAKDHGVRLWVCPMCELAQLDAYYSLKLIAAQPTTKEPQP